MELRPLISTILIVAGIGNLILITSGSRPPAHNPAPPLLADIAAMSLFFLPGTLIGTGIGNLWKRPGLGAILGTSLWGAALFLLQAMMPEFEWRE